MTQIILIGLGAGVASALLYASLISGSMIALLLVLLSPLPILIAALGWSHWAGLVAAITASAGLAISGGPPAFLMVLINFGLPAWWLGYLALLARPASEPTPDGLEWYPAGSLLLWTALAATVTVLAVIPRLGMDTETIYANLRASYERVFRSLTRTPADMPLGGAEIERTITFLSLVSLPGSAVIFTVINIVNLWLAARIVRISGRLKRPWPDLAAVKLPSYAPTLLAGAVAATFLPGLVGLAANVLTASLLIVYAVLGFAVLHTITRGSPGRPIMIGGAYAVCILGWPTLGMTVLGLADTILDIRGRVTRRRGPPSPPQT